MGWVDSDILVDLYTEFGDSDGYYHFDKCETA